MKRAFGWPETVILLVLVALATYGVGSTMLRQTAVAPWLRPTAGVWT